MTRLSHEADRLRKQALHDKRRAASKCILCGCFLRVPGADTCWECRKRKSKARKIQLGLIPNISVWEIIPDGLSRAIMEADRDLAEKI